MSLALLNSSENGDAIYYDRANRAKRLAAEIGTLIRRLNKQKWNLLIGRLPPNRVLEH